MVKKQKTNASGNISKFDIRYHPEVDELLKKVPSIQHRPLVGVNDLKEIAKFINEIPKLDFPIGSAGELIEKLGGSGKTYNIVNIDVDPVRMIHHMPAYYFPISDMDNFVEKIAQLIRQNRRQVDIPVEMCSIERQLVGLLKFPVTDKASLIRALTASKRSFTFQGRKIDMSTIEKRIPNEIFPIKDKQEFLLRIKELMVNAPLIAPH